MPVLCLAKSTHPHLYADKSTFRPSSESHNILRVNGAPLVSTAKASDMSFTEGEQLCSATLDITPLYSTVPGIQNSPNPGVKRILFVKKLNAGTVKKVMTVTAAICP